MVPIEPLQGKNQPPFTYSPKWKQNHFPTQAPNFDKTFCNTPKITFLMCAIDWITLKATSIKKSDKSVPSAQGSH